MEYNNSFDALVRKAVENVEMPMPANAWNEFEKFRTGGIVGAGSTGSGSFITHFIAAGVALVLTVGAINMSTSKQISVNHVPQGQTIISELATDISVSSPVINGDGSLILDGKKVVLKDNNNASMTDNVTENEKKTILRINEKLDRASASADEEESFYKKNKRTTKYVGKDFNLDAPSLFSPNGDGTNDSFIPSALTADDKFEMVIRNEEDVILFKTSDINSPWMGIDLNGDEMPDGKYDWSVMMKKGNTNSIFKGSVKLIRR